MMLTLYDDGIEAVEAAKRHAEETGVPHSVITMEGELPDWAAFERSTGHQWYRVVTRAEWSELDEEISVTWRIYWSNVPAKEG